ncbi:MAG: HAD-IB family phosphatase [Candidatus Methanomethylophilaceae archaeon]|nr:HAD-IB family phosphatase [Candidatus Methanomethylophilaceae archaeon]
MGRKFDLVIFDMDGTLTRCKSSWGFVHDELGVDNDEAYRAFVNMEIDEAEFMRRDIGLWMETCPGIKDIDIARILTRMPLMDGIQETIATLSYNGIKSVICSGGIGHAARMIAEEFGFDGWLADALETDENGVLTGEGIRNIDLMDKGKSAVELMRDFGAAKERTISVGNSYIDISVFKQTGLSIAFNPADEEYTAAAADHVVRSSNLSDILDIILEIENGD